jgi:hypothetical protein
MFDLFGKYPLESGRDLDPVPSRYVSFAGFTRRP